jgi:uncharacterized repeat protein (TIGR04138 family)
MATTGYIGGMPPKNDPAKPRKQKEPKPLLELVEDVGLYPPEAYEFIQQGLSYTVQQVHAAQTDPKASRHVSGQQLCEGLREFAIAHWGFMARTVLRRWNITATVDFGRIVFALVDGGHMQKTDDDTLDDFRNLYDFRTAFESGYRILVPAIPSNS